MRPHVNWGPCISAIPIASTAGLLDVGIYRGNVNSNVVLGFVPDHLALNVLPFNEINPCSIVVMGMFITIDQNAYQITRLKIIISRYFCKTEYFIIAATRCKKHLNYTLVNNE